ncbi:helix-turn-helix transcriptional regulator [Hyphobacterium marinum]|uniref:AraC family transcriptional regulator n=1 Tax=Hyphobacterium marinum TaxID=3116574 RepID=A0ABU7M0Q9_9PROT|nr:AraC family transcriptional regulator [Hyphobacterium sp. Y6023]MEE2567122.1 AraC family transcriptional regulator [Hyphobacterium sp. Y6023]
MDKQQSTPPPAHSGDGRVQPVEISVFDTAGLPGHEQFALWEDSIGVLFDVTADPDCVRHAYRARLDSALVDGTMISRVQAGRQSFRRSAMRPVMDGIESVMFQVFARGGIRQQDDTRRLAGTGMVTGFDLTRESRTVNDQFDLVSFIVPRHEIEDRLGTAMEGVHLNTVGDDTPLARLTADFMLGLQRSLPEMDVEEARAGVRAALDLVTECYRGKARKTAGGTAARAAQLLQAKHFIRRQVREGRRVDQNRVRDFLGCSRATLYRHFAPLGGVASFIRKERLRAALRDMAHDCRAGRKTPIGEIALRNGFESDPHFSRVFKAEFGLSPKDARHALSPGSGKDRDLATANKVDRRYELWLRAIGAS